MCGLESIGYAGLVGEGEVSMPRVVHSSCLGGVVVVVVLLDEFFSLGSDWATIETGVSSNDLNVYAVLEDIFYPSLLLFDSLSSLLVL